MCTEVIQHQSVSTVKKHGCQHVELSSEVHSSMCWHGSQHLSNCWHLVCLHCFTTWFNQYTRRCHIYTQCIFRPHMLFPALTI